MDTSATPSDAPGAGRRRPSSSDTALYAPLSPMATGLACRCPRCGGGPLFKGFLETAPGCRACGLDYAFIDAGDGPAVFVIMIVGFIVVGLALVTEIAFQPPIWVHMVLWLPLTLILSLGLLRPFKGVLIAMQYHHKAAEGQLEAGSGAEPPAGPSQGA
ncbi:DUF983 domain-containing protein [Segnochrobactrum spirostomi]|uniref:DUF983 domain-containing protein n=1 Tax=Segnochrobactrum spirostomi TaxID=2608987 RepID=A0A6A7Y448_9HYPH|nr:DUF983 domain-containing protein [Segnochrobactrum spirostomi]